MLSSILAGPRNPAAAHGSDLREHARRGQASRRAFAGRVGALRRARLEPAQGAGRQVLRRQGVGHPVVRHQGRTRERHQIPRCAAADHAVGQHRRRQVVGHASGVDNPSAVVRRGTRGLGRVTGTGAPVHRYRKRRRTSSPISSRRWTRPNKLCEPACRERGAGVRPRFRQDRINSRLRLPQPARRTPR